MPVNFLEPQRTRPYSITESLRDWGNIRDSQINRDQALGDIGRQQKVRDYYGGLNGGRPDPAALSAIDPEAGIGASRMNREQAQMGAEQVKATKEIMTHFTHSLKRVAQQQGVERGTPQYQQLANQVFQATPIYAQAIQNISGTRYDPSKPIDWQAAENLSDRTPEEQNQLDIAQKVAEQQALEPGRARIAQIQAGGDMNKIMLQDELSGRRDDRRFEREQITRQTPTAYENTQVQQAKQKTLGELDQQEVKFKSSIEQFKNLIELQDKTPTGPIAGSWPVVAGRKMLGDDDIAELEKGYAKASLDAIGAMKESGTTLGALNQSEGEWVKLAMPSIKATGRVNKSIMEQGQKLVQERYKRLIKQKVKVGGFDSLQSTTEKPDKRDGWKIKKKPQPDGSFRYIEIPEDM